MEVIKERSAILSNYEVYSLLKKLQEKRHMKHQKNLATITYETIQYLEQTSCTHQNEEVIGEFLKALQPFNLTKVEKLQLLNHRPATLVEIQLLIEESEERLTEEQMQEILEVVARFLPGGQDEEQDDQDSN
ncbi:DNA-directed RNA polymerase III subunit RPC9-like [Centruroides sculpturatus]|uniref:DNA-directed RNA polymerase III subunit RPC9-like n=1 Tax=Centruroides sculpturatus TaxID=218467 RepID=UPI000C6E3D89|nr:DNA-directed RNA polymerase III subunit RPC9-like [Centruroides sculpturatus]